MQDAAIMSLLFIFKLLYKSKAKHIKRSNICNESCFNAYPAKFPDIKASNEKKL